VVIGDGVVMNVANFNEKLRFIVENGDLSINGVLYREYSDAFDEWYVDPLPEEFCIDPGYPESDFREWVASRLLNVGDEDPEISVEHLEEEIDRIKNARKD
jgi:hypothetical protein